MKAKTVLPLAALLVSCAGLQAADASVDVQKSDRVRDRNPDSAYRHEAVNRDMGAKITKASALIGMDVKNAQNEKLGTIKDIAFDIHTGRIAYAVLSTGGVLGIGDKLVAIPTSAFQTSTDEKFLVLNADKQKLETTPGFDKNNWPAMPSASWGADIDVNRDRPLRNNAIEKRHDNEPTVQDLKRQAERNRETAPPPPRNP